MDAILISTEQPRERELFSFPVICLCLFPRQIVQADTDNIPIWRQLRDLVFDRCGGKVGMLARDDALLFYPNNFTPLLATLLTEPAFFDYLEQHDFDGHAVRLFFHHSYRWNGLPFRPVTPVAEEEEQLLSKFNHALQQMGHYSATGHFILDAEPQQRALYTTVPPMGWFVKDVVRHRTGTPEVDEHKQIKR
jgi:hypothetical protein